MSESTDYAPVFTPGRAVGFTASADVTAGQIVAVTGDYQVAPATPATPAVGVAGHDAESGAAVAVWLLSGPVHAATTSAAIAAGKAVCAGPAGKAAASGPVIGLAVRGAPNGGTVEFVSAPVWAV